MNNAHLDESTKTAVFTYARQLRTMAFDMERWESFSSLQPSAKKYYTVQLDTLAEEGQRLEGIFAEDMSESTDVILTHDGSSGANLPLPQVLYQAADTLCKIASGDFTGSEIWRFSYAISGDRNGAEDAAGAMGESLQTQFRGVESTDLGLS
jgi:hypothetical protein